MNRRSFLGIIPAAIIGPAAKPMRLALNIPNTAPENLLPRVFGYHGGKTYRSYLRAKAAAAQGRSVYLGVFGRVVPVASQNLSSYEKWLNFRDAAATI